MRVTKTNQEIFYIFENFMKHFNDDEQMFPVRVNFYLQKNKKTLLSFAQEIETARMEIITKYGSPSKEAEGQYIIPPESITIAQRELDDLYSLEQDIDLYTVNIDAFPEDMKLTSGQMEALLFMIDN